MSGYCFILSSNINPDRLTITFVVRSGQALFAPYRALSLIPHREPIHLDYFFVRLLRNLSGTLLSLQPQVSSASAGESPEEKVRALGKCGNFSF